MVNVGVIGIGNMGANHARVYSELDEANLVAISDISGDGRKIADKFGCRWYRDYHEMLRDETMDAVSIAVPTNLHEKVSRDCLNAKKHVLVEKPIADTVLKAGRIISTARKNGRILMVGHIERFNPAVQKLRDFIKQGKLGDITSITARRVGIFPPQIKDANVILDLAVHDIDVFNYLLQKDPSTIYAKASRALDTSREDHAIIVLDYGKTNCFIQVNWMTPVKIRNLAVTGTKGYAELNYITQELRVYESIYERTYDTFGDFVIKFGTPKEVEVKVEKEEPLKAELKHFIECVEKLRAPAVRGEDGLLALKLSLKAIESCSRGVVVEV